MKNKQLQRRDIFDRQSSFFVTSLVSVKFDFEKKNATRQELLNIIRITKSTIKSNLRFL